MESSNKREYGRANLSFDIENPLFENVKTNSQVWMSHGDTIKNLTTKFNKIASTSDVENAAFHIDETYIFGLQFHPEVFIALTVYKSLKTLLLIFLNVLQTGRRFIC